MGGEAIWGLGGVGGEKEAANQGVPGLELEVVVGGSSLEGKVGTKPKARAPPRGRVVGSGLRRGRGVVGTSPLLFPSPDGPGRWAESPRPRLRTEAAGNGGGVLAWGGGLHIPPAGSPPSSPKPPAGAPRSPQGAECRSSPAPLHPSPTLQLSSAKACQMTARRSVALATVRTEASSWSLGWGRGRGLQRCGWGGGPPSRTSLGDPMQH